MSESTQTVFRVTLKDGIDGIHPVQEPIPTPNPYELLVKIHAVSLNYRDIAIASNDYPLPIVNNVIPCNDMAGEVITAGSMVKGFEVGDKIIMPVSAEYLYGDIKDGYFDETYGSDKDGMLRQYIVLPAHIAVKVPKTEKAGWEQWASVACTGSTVWNAFYGNKRLMPGDTVLLQGTGGISIMALVLAKAAGAKTIITSSSDEKLEKAKALGADYTINYKTTSQWAAEVNRITNGGVDHILENGGLDTIEQSIECVATGGVISQIGFLAMSKQEQPSMLMPILIKAAVYRGVRGGSKHQLEEVVRFFGEKELALPVDKVFGYNRDEIVAAFKYVKDGKHFGKVCINLD